MQSSEEVFWYTHVPALKAAGISTGMGVKLLKAMDGNFEQANRALVAAMATKWPMAYIGKTISNLKESEEQPPSRARVKKTKGRAKKEPEWIEERRANGALVRREGHLWRVAGDLCDDSGEVVGW